MNLNNIPIPAKCGNLSAQRLTRFAHLAVKDKYMGRKKNEDRPIELQTSPINLRVTNEARQIIDSIPKYERGKWLSKIIVALNGEKDK